MAKKKEEVILNPQVIPQLDFSPEKFFNDENNTKNKISQKLQLPDVIDMGEDINNKSSDTYFKQVLEQYTSPKNISMKTEYLNANEQFSVSVLKFLVNECGFEMCKSFVPTWKKDRVSLNRNGRKEFIMVLWERQREREAQEEKEMLKQRVNL